jgi:outer membrane protein assembly factor BamB
MPRDPQVLLYIGIKNSVIALNDKTGEEVWRVKLRGSDYVAVMWDGEALIAANSGEVWRLDPASGTVIWRNELKGLGRGLVTLASSRRPTNVSDNESAAAKRRNDQMAGTSAAVTAAAVAAG